MSHPLKIIAIPFQYSPELTLPENLKGLSFLHNLNGNLWACRNCIPDEADCIEMIRIKNDDNAHFIDGTDESMTEKFHPASPRIRDQIRRKALQHDLQAKHYFGLAEREMTHFPPLI